MLAKTTQDTLDFSQLWRLNSELKATSVWLERVEKDPPGEQLPSKVLLGEADPPSPCVFKVFQGRTVCDELPTSALFYRVYSEAFFDVLEREHLTGWSSYAVEVRGLPRKYADAHYRGLIVKGRCGPIDETQFRSATKLAIPPYVRPTPIFVGTYFDPNSWDGSDIFTAQGSAALTLTHRAKQALERARLRGVGFERLNNESHPDLSGY